MKKQIERVEIDLKKNVRPSIRKVSKGPPSGLVRKITSTVPLRMPTISSVSRKKDTSCVIPCPPDGERQSWNSSPLMRSD